MTDARTGAIRKLLSLPWHRQRNAHLPAPTFRLDDCVRIGCSERGSCGCIAAGLRPRVEFETAYFEFHANYLGGVWMRARDQAWRPKISAAKRARILARDGLCMRCGSTESLEVDHIIPVARGGSSDDANLQALCKQCNCSKGDSAPEVSDA